MEFLNSLNMTEEWKKILLIIGLIFSVAIFGVLHQISDIILYILLEIRDIIEDIFFRTVIIPLGIKIEDKVEKNFKHPNIVNVIDVEKYLINNENPRIQKLYENQEQAIKDNSRSKQYAVEIVLLLLVQLKFNLVLFKLLNEIAQQFDFPIVKLIQILCIVLVFYASRSCPDSWDWLYIPNNPIKKN